MKKLFFISIIFSLFLASSCKPTSKPESGIGYTEFIESKALVKFVVDNYPDGREKAIVYRLSDDPKQKPVKEVHFFSDGKTQVEGTLKNGERHGVWTFYHENGRVWSTGTFDMGKSNGLFKIYDKEGQLKFKYLYKNNQIIKEDYFVDGKLYKTVDKQKP